MKWNKISMLSIFSFLIAGTLMISSCGDDERLAPVVTLSSNSFNGKTGETASTTVNATIDGEYKELRVTKYLGTDIDASYGTNGTMTISSALPYTLTHELTAEGLENPVRFQFVVEDMEGQTGEANFVITTELTLSYALTRFNWQWNAKIGKILDADPETDQIVDCEKDNIFSFNEDGSMSIDYGALTGAGGATCDFDGLNPYVKWELNADESVLTLTKDNAFDPGNFSTEVYTIVSFSTTDIEAKSPVDLTFLGGILHDWTFTYKAVPK